MKLIIRTLEVSFFRNPTTKEKIEYNKQCRQAIRLLKVNVYKKMNEIYFNLKNIDTSHGKILCKITHLLKAIEG